jgi:hypothetical protein
MTACPQVGVVLSNTTIGMLLATINSSIILIALDIFPELAFLWSYRGSRLHHRPDSRWQINGP